MPCSTPVMMPAMTRTTLRPAPLALAIALAGSATAAFADTPDIQAPREWPLPFERSEATTPLRARMLAMQSHRAAPATRAAAVRAVTTCTDDDSAGSLRSLVASSVSGDTIDLGQLDCDHITLTGGVLDIDVEDLAFRGPGAAELVIDGNEQDRVFRHNSSGVLTIENLTLTRGRHVATGTDVGYGGCIAAGGTLTLVGSVVRGCTAIGVGSYGGAVLSGPLVMRNSTVSGNTAFGDHPTNGTAAYGGGLFSYGVEISDSTISGNRAIGTHNPPLSHWEIGGGLFIARNGGIIERTTIDNNYAMRFAGGLTQEGDLILRNATISGNRARDDDGGGLRVRQVTAVYVENSTITDNHAGTTGGGISFINHALPSLLGSSLVAGNFSGSGNVDIETTMPLELSGTGNLVGRHNTLLDISTDTLSSDPRLLPLAFNGGPTRTHALGPDSPARDHGNNAQLLSSDQRGPGFARVVDGIADIGAYEIQGVAGEAVMLPAGSSWATGALALLLSILGLVGLRTRTSSR